MSELLIPITYPKEIGDTCAGYQCIRDNGGLRCERCHFKGKFMCRVVGCNIYPESGGRIPVVWKALSNTLTL